MPDRRKSARLRTYLGGRISVDRIETFDVGCTVRNVGEGGARLILQRPTLVPSTFKLGISGEDGRRGRLVWYRGGEMGIAFADAQSVEPKPAPHDAAPDGTTLPMAPLQVRMQAITARRRATVVGFTRP